MRQRKERQQLPLVPSQKSLCFRRIWLDRIMVVPANHRPAAALNLLWRRLQSRLPNNRALTEAIGTGRLDQHWKGAATNPPARGSRNGLRVAPTALGPFLLDRE